jgi:hypothetical protein
MTDDGLSSSGKRAAGPARFDLMAACIVASKLPPTERLTRFHGGILRQNRVQVLPQRFEFIAFWPPTRVDIMANTVTGDRATQECDLSTVAVPYGTGWRLTRCQPLMSVSGALMRKTPASPEAELT